MSDLQKKWADVCNEYLRKFCEKHEFDYETAYWVGDDPGTIACVADIFVGMDEMRYDIDNNVPEDKFLKWYDYSLDVYNIESDYHEKQDIKSFIHINYPSFCKGAPLPYTEEDLDSFRKLLSLSKL